MTYLRQSSVGLAVGLTAFYNIERFDIQNEAIVNIASFVYILGAGVVTAILLSRFLAKQNVVFSAGLTFLIYMSSKIIPFTATPVLGGMYTYVTITELALLMMLVWLAHRVSRALSDFNQAVENITFQNVSRRVQRLDDAVDSIENEMYLSRRYDRPLSVMVLQCEPESIQVTLNRAVQEVQRTMMAQYVAASMVKVLDTQVRRMDLLLEQRERGRFIVVCPETDVDQSAVLCNRLKTAIYENIGVTIACGISTFPEGAPTFDELVKHAENQIPSSQHINFPSSKVRERSNSRQIAVGETTKSR